MEETNNKKAASRAPVVVIMGHVDHGKTTLLDSIRKTDVAAREFGGITQKIGAYQVSTDEGKLTFIDTPGHEAFTKMRSQGAKVADVAVLVVGANDSVKPQTIESIKIIQEAKIPYVVAINKIDLPEANVDKTIQDLIRYSVMIEGYGGEVPVAKISAKTGQGVKELLDLIKLLCDINGLTGSAEGELLGIVIESKLDKAKGAVATVIIKDGRLKVGETVFFGQSETKIRSLIDYQGKQLPEVVAGMPVEVLGLTSVPKVGEVVSRTPIKASTDSKNNLVSNRKEATTEDKGQQLQLILRADTAGSLEAISLSIPENVTVLSTQTGDISEADVLHAKSTHAIILGFNVKISTSAEKLAESEKILVRIYKIIYELLEELTDAANGMLDSLQTEEIMGVGQIVAEFPYEKLRVAGTRVLDGRLAKGDKVRVTRGEEKIGEGKIKSLRMGKVEANKAEKGKECGIIIEPQFDFHLGDDIIAIR